jgi:hypothetical protein
VAQLRAAFAEAGEASGLHTDDGAFQCAILGEAADDGLHLSGIERGGVAHERVVDHLPIIRGSGYRGSLAESRARALTSAQQPWEGADDDH